LTFDDFTVKLKWAFAGKNLREFLFRLRFLSIAREKRMAGYLEKKVGT